MANIVTFDIETTSMIKDGKKLAWMYCWQMNVNGTFILGRTWSEWADKIVELIREFNVNSKNKLYIYVHNLAYEFQFIRKFFDWTKILTQGEERKVIYAETSIGIQFRCSYFLSGKKLATLGEEVGVPKLVGDLDYTKIRTPLTQLEEAEIAYCRNDVDILYKYIKNKLEQHGSYKNIPLTKTGYVRQFVREKCFENKNYYKIMDCLKLTNQEYLMLRKGFMGGFTHSTGNLIDTKFKVFKNVKSFDLSSAYPAVILTEQFPMSSGLRFENITLNEYNRIVKNKLVIMKVKFTDIYNLFGYESYISESHCEDLSGEITVNGRIFSAESLTLTITNVDFDIINKVYSYDNVEILEGYSYNKDYLPKEIILAVLELYGKKTKLKGVIEKEIEYILSKEMLNSVYGMMVTDIIRDEITYENDTWDSKSPDLATSIDKYNSSKKRFLYYPWGVWVTAYNRYRLWESIIEASESYIYSDTDSNKSSKDLTEFVTRFNKNIDSKIDKIVEHYSLEKNLFYPLDIKGNRHPVGYFENDGNYRYFKTLGAKRYIWVKDNGEISLTVSGLNKLVTMPYLLDKLELKYENILDKNNNVVGYKLDNPEDGLKVLELFNDELYIPKEYTGKLTHTYIDTGFTEKITDYLGNEYEVNELSYIHLEEAPYDMTVSDFLIQTLKLLIFERDYYSKENSKLELRETREKIKTRVERIKKDRRNEKLRLKRGSK